MNALEGPDENLREATLRSVRWVFLARIVVEAFALGSTVVLARLLSPAAFGHAVIALLFTSLAIVLIGVAGPLLIQRSEVTVEQHEACALLGVALGVVLALIMFFALPVATQPLFGSETAGLIRLSAPSALLMGIAVTPQAILQRRLRFRRISEIEIVSTIVGTLATVLLAVLTRDPSALILGNVVTIGVMAAGTLLSVAPVRPRWHRELLDVAGFGAMSSLSALAALAYSNLDYAILGARLSPTVVGLYWRAYQLGAEYQGKISIVMLRLAFPVYSRSADPEQLRRIRTRIVRVHATVIFPLLGILIVTAPDLIPWAYGPAWRGAVLPTQILASVGMMAAALTGITQLMLAIGNLRRTVVLSWIAVSIYATTIYFVAPHGVIAVCVADACLYFALLVACHYFLASKQAGIPLISLWEEVRPALAGVAVLIAVTGPLAGILSRAGMAAPAVVAAIAAVGLPVYLFVIRRVSSSAWNDLLLLRARMIPARGAPELTAA